MAMSLYPLNRFPVMQQTIGPQEVAQNHKLVTQIDFKNLCRGKITRGKRFSTVHLNCGMKVCQRRKQMHPVLIRSRTNLRNDN